MFCQLIQGGIYSCFERISQNVIHLNLRPIVFQSFISILCWQTWRALADKEREWEREGERERERDNLLLWNIYQISYTNKFYFDLMFFNQIFPSSWISLPFNQICLEPPLLACLEGVTASHLCGACSHTVDQACWWWYLLLTMIGWQFRFVTYLQTRMGCQLSCCDSIGRTVRRIFFDMRMQYSTLGCVDSTHLVQNWKQPLFKKVVFVAIKPQSYNNHIFNLKVFLFWSHSKLIEKLLDASDMYCLKMETTINFTGNSNYFC